MPLIVYFARRIISIHSLPVCKYARVFVCLWVCVCVCVCLLYTSVARLYFSAITQVNLYMLGEELNKQYAFVLILKICML